MRALSYWMLVVGAIVVLDQTSKALATTIFPAFHGEDELVSFGIALNTTKSTLPGLFALSYLISIRLPTFPKCLIVASGLSNIMEEMFTRGVVDFIGLRTGECYLVVNLADIMIVCGFFWLVGMAIQKKISIGDFLPGSILARQREVTHA